MTYSLLKNFLRIYLIFIIIFFSFSFFPFNSFIPFLLLLLISLTQSFFFLLLMKLFPIKINSSLWTFQPFQVCIDNSTPLWISYDEKFLLDMRWYWIHYIYKLLFTINSNIFYFLSLSKLNRKNTRVVNESLYVKGACVWSSHERLWD